MKKTRLFLIVAVLVVVGFLFDFYSETYALLNNINNEIENIINAEEIDVNANADINKNDVEEPVEAEPITVNLLEGTTVVGEDGKVYLKNTDDYLVLVNKQRNLPADYTPQDLVIPEVPFSFTQDLPKKYMRVDAARALERMFQQAKADGIKLVGISGYRSYQTQKDIFTYNVKRKGEEEANKTSARPGQSEHQTGLAMDVSSAGVNYTLSEKFGQTIEGQWLAANAPNFGFIIRYPKDKTHITGYNYEPWHVRYVGIEHALKITNLDITLEEYLGQGNNSFIQPIDSE